MNQDYSHLQMPVSLYEQKPKSNDLSMKLLKHFMKAKGRSKEDFSTMCPSLSINSTKWKSSNSMHIKRTRTLVAKNRIFFVIYMQLNSTSLTA